MADSPGKLIAVVALRVAKLVFLALVAWGAVDGGAWGEGFAIFIALTYLETMRNSLLKLEAAAEDPDRWRAEPPTRPAGPLV